MRVVATAGHVDHGKSSLVLALTGTDPDRFEEEQRRGLTIDLGFAHTTLPSGDQISFVDVPGHVRFLRNMLAGVGGVDACLFVVAATEGWKPQSEEHLRILELVGIRHGIVALTKTDAADDELRELAALDVADRVGGTFLEGAPIVPVSSTSGAGLDELRDALDDLVRRTPAAVDRGRARLWVDRVFAAKGSGTVVTGTLAGGTFTVGEHVVAGAPGAPARIRAIQTLGRNVEAIGPGNRVALNLAGIDHHQLARGDAVTHPGRWHATARFDASLEVLASLAHPVSRRGAYAVHIGSGEHAAKLRVLGTEEIAPGRAGSIRLHLQQAVPLLPGDRFIVREHGRSETVGGGEVLDVAPVLPASKARPDRSTDRVIAERGWIDVDELELLTGERRAPTIGRWVATAARVAAASDELRARVGAAGPLGLDIAPLDDRERALLESFDGVSIDAGRARPAESNDSFVAHPLVQQFLDGGFAPAAPDPAEKATTRELIRRKLLVERDGVVFHPAAIDSAALVAARLLAACPEGFSIAQFRDAIGATRKHVLPLLAELDGRGITRRRGDVRIAGPRLPLLGADAP
ncbi:MAG: selenocysteine-specific translation elongation factor [Acidimicrobiia bacterium]